MKLTKVLCIAALVAMSAAVANAGSILGDSNSPSDPKLTVNKPGGLFHSAFASPMNLVMFSSTSQMHPLIVSMLGTTDYEYTGPGTNHMYIEVFPANPSEAYTCSSDIFKSGNTGPAPWNCSSAVAANSPGVEFFLFDGMLTHDEQIVVSLESVTPEASTVLLFLSLIPALFFAAKRWNGNARQTA